MQAASLDFGSGTGVFDLDLTLQPGSILGIIGPSGSGKTTTVRLLAGVYQPTAGEVQVLGAAPHAFLDADKRRIGYMPQHFLLYPHLNVEENLHFMGGMYGLPRAERRSRIDLLLEFFDLEEARKRLGKHLSGGMKRRLMLAGTLLHEPSLIFADEPTAGIDPILRARIWDYFRELRAEQRSLVITTQYVGEAAYCDQVAVMRRGRIIFLDTPRGLRRQAMGGDVIHMQVEEAVFEPLLELLADLPQVRQVRKVDEEEYGMYVLVADADREAPGLVAVLRDSLGVTPTLIEQYTPSFDEVFVRLIEQVEEGECAPGSYRPIPFS
jgi:ABC-2 type transport system ATP-binding protein